MRSTVQTWSKMVVRDFAGDDCISIRQASIALNIKYSTAKVIH